MYCKGAGCAPCEKLDPCDGYDNNCDGIIDNTPLSDADSDTYPVCGHLDPTSGEFVELDCDDNDPTVHPNAEEVCNGKDNDCDGDAQTEGCPDGQQCVQRGLNGGWLCANPSDLCTATSCIPPKICDPNTRQCVDPPTIDAGGTCSTDSECTSHICATDAIVTAQVAKGSGVCTQTCCTSSDCPDSLVCFAPGTGGNYCVSPSLIGRSTPGGGTGGVSCNSATDCRSGLCSDSQVCIDTCCDDSQCGRGTRCYLQNVSGHMGFSCAASTGTHVQNQTCSANNNADCKDGLCLDYGVSWRCAEHCCGSANCGSIDFGYNQTFQAICSEPRNAQQLGNDGVPICAVFSTPSGNAPLGAQCQQGSDCRSGRCNTSLGKCYDVCCTDADCSAVRGWKCRPYPPANDALRCVP
jgi:hypothetical protein